MKKRLSSEQVGKKKKIVRDAKTRKKRAGNGWKQAGRCWKKQKQCIKKVYKQTRKYEIGVEGVDGLAEIKDLSKCVLN